MFWLWPCSGWPIAVEPTVRLCSSFQPSGCFLCHCHHRCFLSVGTTGYVLRAQTCSTYKRLSDRRYISIMTLQYTNEAALNWKWTQIRSVSQIQKFPLTSFRELLQIGADGNKRLQMISIKSSSIRNIYQLHLKKPIQTRVICPDIRPLWTLISTPKWFHSCSLVDSLL